MDRPRRSNNEDELKRRKKIEHRDHYILEKLDKQLDIHKQWFEQDLDITKHIFAVAGYKDKYEQYCNDANAHKANALAGYRRFAFRPKSDYERFGVRFPNKKASEKRDQAEIQYERSIGQLQALRSDVEEYKRDIHFLMSKEFDQSPLDERYERLNRLSQLYGRRMRSERAKPGVLPEDVERLNTQIESSDEAAQSAREKVGEWKRKRHNATGAEVRDAVTKVKGAFKKLRESIVKQLDFLLYERSDESSTLLNKINTTQDKFKKFSDYFTKNEKQFVVIPEDNIVVKEFVESFKKFPGSCEVAKDYLLGKKHNDCKDGEAYLQVTSEGAAKILLDLSNSLENDISDLCNKFGKVLNGKIQEVEEFEQALHSYLAWEDQNPDSQLGEHINQLRDSGKPLIKVLDNAKKICTKSGVSAEELVVAHQAVDTVQAGRFEALKQFITFKSKKAEESMILVIEDVHCFLNYLQDKKLFLYDPKGIKIDKRIYTHEFEFPEINIVKTHDIVGTLNDGITHDIAENINKYYKQYYDAINDINKFSSRGEVSSLLNASKQLDQARKDLSKELEQARNLEEAKLRVVIEKIDRHFEELDACVGKMATIIEKYEEEVQKYAKDKNSYAKVVIAKQETELESVKKFYKSPKNEYQGKRTEYKKYLERKGKNKTIKKIQSGVNKLNKFFAKMYKGNITPETYLQSVRNILKEQVEMVHPAPDLELLPSQMSNPLGTKQSKAGEWSD